MCALRPCVSYGPPVKKRYFSLFGCADYTAAPRNKRQEETLKELRNGMLEGRVADGAIYFDPTASK